jgi:hypothetical protein
MTPHYTRLSSAAQVGLRSAFLFLSIALLAACESSGPRTGKLSIAVSGLPSTTAAQITIKNTAGFTRTVTGSEVIASLKPGDYTIKATSVFDGVTRYSAVADSQQVTITKSDTPVEASVSYAVSSAVLTVNVAGTPAGSTAAVRVTGPNAFSQTIAATTTLTGLNPGGYTVVAPEIAANQQRFTADRSFQQLQLAPGLNATSVSINYAQITGNLTFAVTGLPSGVTGDISVSGPVASYVVGTTSDLVGVRAGTYTVTVKSVTSGTTTYLPSFATQTYTLAAGGTVVVTVNYTSSDGPLNFTIDGMTLTQVVQNYAGTVPLVSGRDAFIRVFARASKPNDNATTVRARFYQDETLVRTLVLQRSGSVPLSVDQSSLSNSWNGLLSAQYIRPGLRVLFDVDPDNTTAEASENDNSFPSSGTPQAVDVRDAAPLRLTLVPIIQRFDKSLVGNVSDANKENFLGDARRMLPIVDIDAEVHAPYTTTDSLELTSNDGNNEWLRVLSEMNTLRIAESSQRHYYGVVKVSYNSGVAGYGYVPGRAAVGWDYIPSGRNVFAHEVTHNFGRSHAPCGGVAGADPQFPYAGGTIGVYGYDLTNSTLKVPSAVDLMGYCSNPWISDYNYVGAMTWRQSNPVPDVASATSGFVADGASRPTLLVWGRVERGQLILEPAFSLAARPSLPRESGPYRVEGITRSGRTLFSYSFAGEQPADATNDPTARQFAFAIPMDNATQSELATLRLSGGGSAPAALSASIAPAGVSAAINSAEATSAGSGSVSVRWGGASTRMALVRDRRTGQVLSFARGGNVVVRPRAGAELEVILSDGVRSAAKQLRVTQR